MMRALARSRDCSAVVIQLYEQQQDKRALLFSSPPRATRFVRPTLPGSLADMEMHGCRRDTGRTCCCWWSACAWASG